MNLDEEEADNIILVKIFQWRQDSVAQLIFLVEQQQIVLLGCYIPFSMYFLPIIDLEQMIANKQVRSYSKKCHNMVGHYCPLHYVPFSPYVCSLYLWLYINYQFFIHSNYVYFLLVVCFASIIGPYVLHGPNPLGTTSHCKPTYMIIASRIWQLLF